jgi:hypothetical protein
MDLTALPRHASVLGFLDYVVTITGEVWSRKPLRPGYPPTWHRLKPTPDTGGHPKVLLYRDGKRPNVRVDKLVAIAFLGPRPFSGAKLRHLDGDPANCDVHNLAWSTKKPTKAGPGVHGPGPRDYRHDPVKLDTFDVWGIRFLARDGRQQNDIAATFGVTVEMVHRIIRRSAAPAFASRPPASHGCASNWPS